LIFFGEIKSQKVKVKRIKLDEGILEVVVDHIVDELHVGGHVKAHKGHG
jgi:DNA-binding IscR family transcriptional regulator